jgi:hypothetical protein
MEVDEGHREPKRRHEDNNSVLALQEPPNKEQQGANPIVIAGRRRGFQAAKRQPRALELGLKHRLLIAPLVCRGPGLDFERLHRTTSLNNHTHNGKPPVIQIKSVRLKFIVNKLQGLLFFGFQTEHGTCAAGPYQLPYQLSESQNATVPGSGRKNPLGFQLKSKIAFNCRPI